MMLPVPDLVLKSVWDASLSHMPSLSGATIIIATLFCSGTFLTISKPKPKPETLQVNSANKPSDCDLLSQINIEFQYLEMQEAADKWSADEKHDLIKYRILTIHPSPIYANTRF